MSVYSYFGKEIIHIYLCIQKRPFTKLQSLVLRFFNLSQKVFLHGQFCKICCRAYPFFFPFSLQVINSTQCTVSTLAQRWPKGPLIWYLRLYQYFEFSHLKSIRLLFKFDNLLTAILLHRNTIIVSLNIHNCF